MSIEIDLRSLADQLKDVTSAEVEGPEVTLLGLEVPIAALRGSEVITEEDLQILRPWEFAAEGPEQLIEVGGRTCYMSQEKITPESAARFVEHATSLGHHSVIEHSQVTFRIAGVSRAFSHQWVRHRLEAISQMSQRYCDEGGFRSIVPPSIRDYPEALELFRTHQRFTKLVYHRLQAMTKEGKRLVRNEDARFVLTNATETELVVSMNFRELRHIFQVRCAPAAQWEIREVALQMLKVMQRISPSVFGDFVIDEEKRTALVRPLTCEVAREVLEIAGHAGFSISEKEIQALEHLRVCQNPKCRDLARSLVIRSQEES